MRLRDEERDQVLWAVALMVQDLVRGNYKYNDMPDHLSHADEVIMGVAARIRTDEERV